MPRAGGSPFLFVKWRNERRRNWRVILSYSIIRYHSEQSRLTASAIHLLILLSIISYLSWNFSDCKTHVVGDFQHLKPTNNCTANQCYSLILGKLNQWQGVGVILSSSQQLLERMNQKPAPNHSISLVFVFSTSSVFLETSPVFLLTSLRPQRGHIAAFSHPPSKLSTCEKRGLLQVDWGPNSY